VQPAVATVVPEYQRQERRVTGRVEAGLESVRAAVAQARPALFDGSFPRKEDWMKRLVLAIALLAAVGGCSGSTTDSVGNGNTSSGSGGTSAGGGGTSAGGGGNAAAYPPDNWQNPDDFLSVRRPDLDCSRARLGDKVNVLKVVTGDLTGDGAPEAVVREECDHSASEWPDSVYVFTYDGGTKLLATLVKQGDDVYATPQPFSGNAVTVKLDGWSPSAGGCCPDLHYSKTFAWNGSGFEVSGGLPGGGSGGGGGQGAGRCDGSQLGVSADTFPDASGAKQAVVLVITNNGSSSCTLTGYPGVDAVDQSTGNTVASAKRTTYGPIGLAYDVKTITLAASGGQASTFIEFNAYSAGGSCPGFSISTTPPDTTATVSFEDPQITACDLQVHPVVAGSDGHGHA